MFKKNIYLMLSLMYLILELLIGIMSLKIDFSNNATSVLIFILLDLVVPILLYYFYFNSGYCKIIAFVLPFLTSAFAWFISAVFYHISTDFAYYNIPELGTGLSFGIFCVIHIVSAVVFTILSLATKSNGKVK